MNVSKPLPLAGAHNVRDLGGYPTAVSYTHLRFVDFPSPAVSSKLHWNECIPFIGDHIKELVKRIQG